MAMWRGDELVLSRIAADVEGGLFFIAECEDEAAGVMKFQLEDGQSGERRHPGKGTSAFGLAHRADAGRR